MSPQSNLQVQSLSRRGISARPILTEQASLSAGEVRNPSILQMAFFHHGRLGRIGRRILRRLHSSARPGPLKTRRLPANCMKLAVSSRFRPLLRCFLCYSLQVLVRVLCHIAHGAFIAWSLETHHFPGHVADSFPSFEIPSLAISPSQWRGRPGVFAAPSEGSTRLYLHTNSQPQDRPASLATSPKLSNKRDASL